LVLFGGVRERFLVAALWRSVGEDASCALSGSSAPPADKDGVGRRAHFLILGSALSDRSMGAALIGDDKIVLLLEHRRRS
jgi:hypothetical protein